MAADSVVGDLKYWHDGLPFAFLSTIPLGDQKYWSNGISYEGLFPTSGTIVPLTATLSDSLSLADAIVLRFLANYNISVTDALIFVDSISATLYAHYKLQINDVLNFTDDIVLQILGFQTIALADTLSLTDAVALQLYAHLTAVFDDILDLSDDTALELFTPLLQRAVSDTLSLTDAITLSYVIGLNLSDTLQLLDNLNGVDFLIFVGALSLAVQDRLELGDEAFKLEMTGLADYILDIRETLHFSDYVEIVDPKTDIPSDTMVFTDAIQLSMAGAAYAYDTLFYNWGDDIKVELAMNVSVADTLALADAVTLDLIIIGILRQVSDTLDLQDALALEARGIKRVGDNFVLSDEIRMLLTHALRVGDTLAFADAIGIDYTRITAFEDTLSFQDAIQVSMSTPLEVAVADSLDIFDSVAINRRGTNASYLRRYLNDVVNS